MTIAATFIATNVLAARRQYSTTELRIMAAGVIATNGNPESIPPSVLAGFALVESSGINCGPYPDGNTKAFGLFGFHLSRWLECGGLPEEWGRATEMRQMEVMYVALQRYAAAARRHHSTERIRFAANAHHYGHGSDFNTEYAKKIEAAIERAQAD